MSAVVQPVAARPAVDRLALAAALVTVVLWASAFVGIRAAAVDLTAGPLALGRLVVGAIALGVLVLARGPVRPSRRDLVLILASGVLWFAFYNVALNEAERNVDAGTAAMLTNVGPILIAVFAGLFLGEGFPPRLVAGLVVAFAGAVVIGVASASAPVEGGNAQLGVVLCLAAAVAYAVGVTLQKPALAAVPAAQVTAMACATGAIVCLPFAGPLLGELGTAAPESIAWMVYLGLFPTAIGFTTWAFALNRSSAGRLGATTYLVPPIAIVLGALMLGEVPAPLAIAGGALCIAGVIVARSRGSLPWRRARPTEAEA
jgi:drug/metabolite transporter (DMT)-like permease